MTKAHTRTLRIDGNDVHVHDVGDGPAVLLCHGFPGLGYSFRHQLRALADAGFRAIAPDMRGYGGTHAPRDVAEYGLDRVLPELVGLLDACGVEKAVFVGHDFGGPVAWNAPLRFPTRVSGVVGLSVPYEPKRYPTRPSEIFAQTARSHFFHVHYFQEPGRAERELDARAGEFLRRAYHALSGAYRYADVWKHPSEGRGYLDVLPQAPDLPWEWMSAAEMRVYEETFTRTCFRGGLSWYRAYDRNWEISEPFVGARLDVPALYIAGAEDVVVAMGGERAIDRMRKHVPDLRGVHLIPGAGHWVQMERPTEVNRLLIDFLRSL